MSELRELETHFMQDPEAAEGFLAQERAAQIVERGEALVRDVELFILRFVSLPPGLGLPLALWALATHLFDAFDTFPYLAITSPVKRCGKTRLSEVLEPLSARPVRAANLSEAALFRLVDAERPTLLLDEAEGLRSRKGERAEALISLLNAGHRRGAVAYRCNAKTHELRRFQTYSPKVVICIGGLPETLADRSIPVAMQRRRRGENLERFIFRRVKAEAEELHKRLAKAAQVCRQDVAEVHESPTFDVPDLEDREAENWGPLFALCSVLAPGRMAELRRTALRLVGEKASADTDDSLSVRLLADIRDVWPDTEPQVFTEELLRRLRELPESPWSGEIVLVPRKLARMLRPFGVSPKNVWQGEHQKQAKGYVGVDLEPVFSRYLGIYPSNPSKGA